jgi:hypothetical protein
MYIVRPPKAIRLRNHAPSNHRYPIRTALEYHLIGYDGILKAGTGRTILLSSRSVLIESETDLPLNRRVDLWIEWPARLENKVGLRLHIAGRTVGAAGTATEVEILGYEFRTRSTVPKDQRGAQRWQPPAMAVSGALQFSETDETNRLHLIGTSPSDTGLRMQKL